MDEKKGEEKNHGMKKIICCVTIVVLILIGLMICTWQICMKPCFYETAKVYSHYVLNPDSIPEGLTVTKDSIPLSDYLGRIDSVNRVTIQKTDDYVTDVDLMISKASVWIGVWLGIFAIVMTVPTVIQFAKARQNDKLVEASIAEVKEKAKASMAEGKASIAEVKEKATESIAEAKEAVTEIKLMEDKMRCSIREHRISSIMLCLSNAPDPLLTSTPEEKILFIKFFLQFLNKEFTEYIGLLKSYYKSNEKNKTTEEPTDISNMLLLITEIKMALIRSQCVFSDLTQNIYYHIAQKKLDDVLEKVRTGELRELKLTEKLFQVRNEIEKLLASITVK